MPFHFTPQLSYISHAAPSYQLSTPIGTLQGQKRLRFATSYPRYTLGFGARTHGAHTLRILLPVPSKMKTTAGSITFALMHQCQPFQPLQGHRHRILEHRRQQPRRKFLKLGLKVVRVSNLVGANVSFIVSSYKHNANFSVLYVKVDNDAVGLWLLVGRWH